MAAAETRASARRPALAASKDEGRALASDARAPGAPDEAQLVPWALTLATLVLALVLGSATTLDGLASSGVWQLAMSVMSALFFMPIGLWSLAVVTCILAMILEDNSHGI